MYLLLSLALPLCLLSLSSPAAAQDLATEEEGFVLGSYGRAQAASELDGGAGQPVNVVAYGPRLEAQPYAEIDLGWYRKLDDGSVFRVLITPAIAGSPFHYDGQWEADMALRNLYGEAKLLGPQESTVRVWAGSRMYRGDDLYLLNFWPMDMLNTMGGGLQVDRGGLQVQAHAGVNRVVGDDWQVQQWQVPQPGGVGSEPVLVVDRQRRIVSARLSYTRGLSRGLTLRGRAYGEHHSLPAGQRLVEDRYLEDLPADSGWVLGGQLSAWGWAPDSFVHVWLKHSRGLSATGELSVPTTGFAPDYTVTAARQTLLAIGMNHEREGISLALGGYGRAFQDADGQSLDVDDGFELALVARPTVHLSKHISVGLEASHQVLRPNGLNPRTERVDVPQVTKLSVFPQVTPGQGTFSRPMVYGIYTYSRLNPDAQDWFDPADSRAQEGTRHYVGVGVEWWMNSQSYTRS